MTKTAELLASPLYEQKTFFPGSAPLFANPLLAIRSTVVTSNTGTSYKSTHYTSPLSPLYNLFYLMYLSKFQNVQIRQCVTSFHIKYAQKS